MRQGLYLECPAAEVEVFALRELRPRTSGRDERAESSRIEALRRCTRRWFSQRENHHLHFQSGGTFQMHTPFLTGVIKDG